MKALRRLNFSKVFFDIFAFLCYIQKSMKEVIIEAAMRLLKNGQELKAKSLFEAAEQQENIQKIPCTSKGF